MAADDGGLKPNRGREPAFLEPDGVLAYKRRPVLGPDGVLACKRRTVFEADGVLACKRRPVWEPDGVRGQKGAAVGTIPRCAVKKAACFLQFLGAR